MKHAISGYMYNEKGENLSNTLIEKEIYAPAGREMWQRMEQSHLLDGKKDAPVIVDALPIRSAHIVNSSGSRRARG